LLVGEEDEDGFIPYKPFLDKLCGKVPYNWNSPHKKITPRPHKKITIIHATF
jgi:hypothetical protein